MLLNIFENDAVISALGIGLAGLITWLFTVVRLWLNTKIKDVKLKEAMMAATEVIEKSVLTVQQTFVKQLKKSGKFDKDAQEKAFRKAVDRSKTLITEETKNIIEKNFGDLNSFLEIQIESFIKYIK